MTFDPNVPPSLLELQKWFAAIEKRPHRRKGAFKIPLYDKKTVEQIDKRISPGPKLTAAQRIGIYNQQYWWRFFSLMQDRYPALTRLFGRGGFNRTLVEPYLLKHPPCDWALVNLGSGLPRWIAEEYREEDKPLVLQMALLEEALHRLPFAHGLPPLKPEEAGEKLRLQPTVALIDLGADLFSFRESLLEKEPKHWEENEFPPLARWEEMRHFAVTLSDRWEISSTEAVLLRSFEKGASIEEACSLLGEAPQIASWFQQWIAKGWLTTEEAFLSGSAIGTSRTESGAFSS
jgi:hypothetical protein